MGAGQFSEKKLIQRCEDYSYLFFFLTNAQLCLKTVVEHRSTKIANVYESHDKCLGGQGPVICITNHFIVG